MGWDCTLHVVDEGALARLCDRVLGESNEPSAFDLAFEDRASLIERTKVMMASNDADTAGRALGELAILWASAETPHVSSRGFSLSLWDVEAMGAPLPPSLLGSVEELLGPILDAYPRVRGWVPRFFDQNYCVGPLVRARDVPALLAHVMSVLEPMPPGERRPYLGLAKALRAAAAHGMAYWEATDFDVAQAREEWLEEQQPSGDPVLLQAPSPLPGYAEPIARSGAYYVVSEYFSTYLVDASTFPPLVRRIAGLQTTAAAFDVSGRVVARSATDPTVRPYVFSLHEIAPGADSARPMAIEPPWPIRTLRRVHDQVLLFPEEWLVGSRDDLLPLVLRGDRLEPIEGPAPRKVKSSIGSWRLSCEAIAFEDGSVLVVWDGRAYRWVAGTLVPLGGSDVEPEPLGLPSGVALPDGSIAFVLHRRLARIDTTGAREPILPPLNNVMRITLGNDGAFVLLEGNNLEGDALKVWWPRTRELTHLAPAVFGIETSPAFVLYAEETDLLIAHESGLWRALPWSAVKAMPRVSEQAFFIAHEELEARRKKRR